MMTQSGCFGTKPKGNDNIDDAAEVSAAVDDIIETIGRPAENNEAGLLAVHYAMMTQRVRLLTWSVVLLAIYVFVKELS